MWALKAFANLARTTSFACIQGKCARTSFPNATPSEELDGGLSPEWTVCRARCTTRIGAVHTRQRFSIPFGRFAPVRPFLASGVQLSCCRSNEVLRRTYGKDNRVLHTAKLSQGVKVAPPNRTWQGAGISTGRTTIGVIAPETHGETTPCGPDVRC
jgi:hypothetical protein